MKRLADIKHISVVVALEEKDTVRYNKLSLLSGRAFDRAYPWAITRDHEHNLTEYRREAQSGNDPDIRAVASKILGTAEDHLKMADSTDAVVMRTAVSARHRSAAATGA